MDAERRRAVEWAREFLLRLSDHRRSKKIPREIRLEAYSIYRHFPTAVELAGWDGAPMHRSDAARPPDADTTHPHLSLEPTHGHKD